MSKHRHQKSYIAKNELYCPRTLYSEDKQIEKCKVVHRVSSIRDGAMGLLGRFQNEEKNSESLLSLEKNSESLLSLEDSAGITS